MRPYKGTEWDIVFLSPACYSSRWEVCVDIFIRNENEQEAPAVNDREVAQNNKGNGRKK